MKEELLKGLTEEQIAKIKECKTTEEMMALAKKEGVTLNEEQLTAVSGGGCGSTRKCPYCGSKNYDRETKYVGAGGGGTVYIYTCRDCGKKF